MIFLSDRFMGDSEFLPYWSPLVAVKNFSPWFEEFFASRISRAVLAAVGIPIPIEFTINLTRN